MSTRNPYEAKSKSRLHETKHVDAKLPEETLRDVGKNEFVDPVNHYQNAEEVPDANIDGVLTWVGDDKERAEAAIEHEESATKPRKSLIAKLKEIG